MVDREKQREQAEKKARLKNEISQKLFRAYIQNGSVDRIDWDGKCIDRDGQHLSHLVIEDDVILISRHQTKSKTISLITQYFQIGSPQKTYGKN